MVPQLTLTRRRDWQSRLSTYLRQIERQPFERGGHDCLMGLACGAIEAVTGADVGAPWRGRYSTAWGAMRLLREEGFASLSEMLRHALPERPSLLHAHIGDLGLIKGSDLFGEAVVIIDTSSLVVLTEKGLGRLPKRHLKAALAVG